MDFLTYSIVLIVSFFGVILSIPLSNIAIEEISSTSKYLYYLNIIIFPLAIFISIYHVSAAYAVIAALLVLALLIIFKDKNDYTWTYRSFGAIIYLSMLYSETFAVSVIIFIYGLSIGTLSAQDYFTKHHIRTSDAIKSKDFWNMTKILFIRYSQYIITALAFYAVFEWII